ncbi:MAG: putative membrane protein [Bacteroidia bacterium]|jgi:uncharacterized membrane protein
MKIFKYALLFILFVFVGGIIALLFAPSSHSYSNTIQINQPLAVVYGSYLDTSLMPMWLTNVKTVSPLDSNYGQKGSKADIIYAEADKKVDARQEVVKVVEDSAINLVRHLKDELSLHVDASFVSVNPTTTQISLESKIELHKWILKVVMFKSGEPMKNRTDDELNAFKKILESSSFQAKI